MRTSDLERGRTSVIWWSGAHGWTKNIQQDEWGVGNVDPDLPVQGRWRGWIFFRLKESVQAGASSSEVPRLHPDVIQWNPPEQEQPWRPPVQAGASTSSQRRGQVTATERGRLALGVVRAEGHAGPLTSRGPAPSVTSDGSWSVAGSASVKGSMASNAGIPKYDHTDADRVVARATAMAGRSTSSCTSSSASKEVNQKVGYSVDPMLPTLEEPFVNSAFPKGSTVLMWPKPRPSRWADGPTISVRERETARTAMLRALQAPLPPTSLRSPSEPVDETPLDRRNRYQTSMRSDVSDRDLRDFLHGVCPDTPASEIPGDEEDHNKAAESESEITDGSYPVLSSEESMPPSDPKLFFDEVYDVSGG